MNRKNSKIIVKYLIIIYNVVVTKYHNIELRENK